jgi:hypothetical protein
MNTMNTPRFTAEASLSSPWGGGDADASRNVVPADDPMNCHNYDTAVCDSVDYYWTTSRGGSFVSYSDATNYCYYYYWTYGFPCSIYPIPYCTHQHTETISRCEGPCTGAGGSAKTITAFGVTQRCHSNWFYGWYPWIERNNSTGAVTQGCSGPCW